MTVLNAIRRAGVVAGSGTRAAIVGAAAAGPRRFHVMANIASQKKRILRTERERLENRRYTSTVKTYFRRLQAAVEAGDDAVAHGEHRLRVLVEGAAARAAAAALELEVGHDLERAPERLDVALGDVGHEPL